MLARGVDIRTLAEYLGHSELHAADLHAPDGLGRGSHAYGDRPGVPGCRHPGTGSRLARNYERDPATSEALIHWAAIGLMTRRRPE